MFRSIVSRNPSPAPPGAPGASKEPQDGPKGRKQSAKIIQESVETAQGSPTTVQDGFETAHEAPKTAQECFQRTAERAQDEKKRPIPLENVHFGYMKASFAFIESYKLPSKTT